MNNQDEWIDLGYECEKCRVYVYMSGFCYTVNSKDTTQARDKWNYSITMKLASGRYSQVLKGVKHNYTDKPPVIGHPMVPSPTADGLQ